MRVKKLKGERKCTFAALPLIGLALLALLIYADLRFLTNESSLSSHLAASTAQVASVPTKTINSAAVASVPTTTISNTEGGKCPSGSALAKPITLDFSKVQQMTNIDRLHQVKGFTDEGYEVFMTSPAGVEHYTLLHYLSNNYADPELDPACQRRHLVDIGTRYVASSLSMASASSVKVWTFDLPDSMERANAFRGKTEAEWQDAVKAQNIDITFHNVDLLAVSDEDFERYMNTWLIVLDTYHEPYSVPFEREWLKRLVDANFFKGVILLDDINLNEEMQTWWKEMKENVVNDGYVMHDVTKIGHWSGTGLLDFSGGHVSVIENI
jgi:hypothetical protein